MGAPLSGNGVRLDMTPMVDVAFLLLIFFMSTSAIRSANDPQVVLPASQSGSEMDAGGSRVVIAVEEDGEILFSSGRARPAPVPLEEIAARAKGVLGADPKAQIVVFADATVPYGRMSEVFRTLQAAELFRFSLVTEQEEG